MRLFAAITPPDALRRDLDAAMGSRDPRLRWVPPDQWHITVAFYGDVPAEVADSLLTRLERVASRAEPFHLELAQLGGFPSARRARVTYVAVSGDAAALRRLADRCTAAGRRVGLDLEERRFHAHLTLGRSRTEPVDVTSYDALPALPSWPVTSLQLVHSTLGAVVRHETLAEWPLGSGHQA